MRDTKLHLLLSSMDAHELNRMVKFMSSPYHNEEERLMRLCDYLVPFYKNENAAEVDKLKVWKHVYGKRVFNARHYIRLLSDMLKKVEAFVTVEGVRAQSAEGSLILLDNYNKRGLTRNFTEPYTLTLRKLEEQPYRDRDYYFHSFRLSAQHNALLESKKERTNDKRLIETVNALDVYYFVNKLRYSAAILHYKIFLDLDDEFLLLQEILAHLRKKPMAPVADLYHHIILTLIEPDQESHYDQLKAVLFGNTNVLQADTQREGFSFALNYCIRQINTGKHSYQAELFALYKQALACGMMYDNDQINPWDFKNMVTVALRIKEYKWANTFIDNYIPRLKKSEQKNAYTFNRARYYFATGKYGEVLKLLQDVEYTDVFYLLDAKVTLMKTYYELGEYEPLLSLKESFRILLRRKKLISEQNQTNYGNFARLAMKLYRADVKNKVQMASLKKAIEGTPNIADRAWILEKYAQLTG